jgi:hypothetical protein
MICVVLLQGCVGFVGGETAYCSESCVTGGVKVEDPLHIKEECRVNFEAVYINETTCPTIKTEPEVRLWGVSEVVTAVVCEVVIAVV